MSASLVSVVIGALVPLAAMLAALLSYRHRRHMRSWRDRCDAFVRGHQQLDRDLDRVWWLFDV